MCCVGLRQRGNGTQLSTFFNASMNSCDMYCLKSSKVNWIISRRGVVHLSSFNAPSSELLFKMLKHFTPFCQILTPFQAVEQRDPTNQGCQTCMDICLPIFILYLLSWWFQTRCWWIQTALKVSSIPFPSFCLACLAWASRLATSFSSSVISPFTTTRSASAANMDRSMRAKKLSGSGASEAWRGHQGLHGREAVKTWRSVDSQGLTKSWNCILKAGEPFRESSLAWGAALPISSFSTSLLSINSNLIDWY